MARKPPDWREPTLFTIDPDAPPEPQDNATPKPNGGHHAVQNDSARTLEGTNADARATAQGAQAPGDGGALRQRTKEQPPSLDRATGQDAAGKRSEPSGERSPGDRPQGITGSFAVRIAEGRQRGTLPRRGDDVHPPSHVSRLNAARRQQTLFDSVPDNPAGDEPPAAHELPPPIESQSDEPTGNDGLDSADAHPDQTFPLSTIASGTKAKARDIIAAIRILKTVEQENRPANDEEKQILSRFAGFGPVALSIFPDPVTGNYKDAGWQALGDELRTLLTPQEYDSAKRTTFNAFYTSPTVVAAIHEAIARLGVPDNATILEPGCGSGNFMSQGKPEARFIGV